MPYPSGIHLVEIVLYTSTPKPPGVDSLRVSLARSATLKRRLQAENDAGVCALIGQGLHEATTSRHTFVALRTAAATQACAYLTRSGTPLDHGRLQQAADQLLQAARESDIHEIEIEGLRFAGIPLCTEDGLVLGALCLVMDDTVHIDACALAQLADHGSTRLTQLRVIAVEAKEGPFESDAVSEVKLLRTLVDNMPDQIYAKDCNGRFILGNRAAALNILGRPDVDALIGKSDLDFYPVECGQRFFTDEQNIIRTGVPIIDQVEENLTEDGPLRYYSTTKFPFYDDKGKVAGIVGISRDVTLRVSADEVARLRERAVESSQDGIVITGGAALNYAVIYTNPAFENIVGFTLDEAKQCGIERFLLDVDDLSQDVLEREAIIRRHGQQRVLRSLRKDGTQFWSEVRCAVIRTADGTASHYVFTLVDVTDVHRAEEELVSLANHDALTGLPNRRMLMERMSHAVRSFAGGEWGLAVAFIDLDGLKSLNDRHGHEAGDVLLRTVAERISMCIRKTDMIARLGGDEFVLLSLQGAGRAESEADGIAELLHRIQEQIAQPLALGDVVLHPTCSIGVSLLGKHGDDAETLLKRADEAMYVAKRSGRHRIAFAAATTP